MRKTLLMWLLGVIVVLATAVYIEERHGLLAVGSRAPDFSATTSTGIEVSLHQYAGKNNVVLFFYPKDFTAGCTAEACSMRDGYDELRALDAVVYGVSGDASPSHEKFRNRYELPFELLADTNRSLIRAYGVERMGGIIGLAKRVTYVIDKERIIRLVSHHELRMEGHVADVLQTLRTLKSRP